MGHGHGKAARCPLSGYYLVYPTILVIALICILPVPILDSLLLLHMAYNPISSYCRSLMLSSHTLGEEAHPYQGKTQDPSDAHCFKVCLCVYVYGGRKRGGVKV